MKQLLELKEFLIAGLYEEQDRGLFYRKALGLRRYYENCKIPIYNGELLFPSGCLETPKYSSGLMIDLNALSKKNKKWAERVQKDFFQYQSSVPEEHTVAGNMSTHSFPNYERILKEGLLSYVPRIEKMTDTDLRDGLLHLVKGISKYVERCIQYLISVGADVNLLSALRKVPLYPAETIYEAIVAWNFIMYLDHCDNLGCIASGLLPYYRGENVVKLLENLFDNLDANNGYSMALGMDYNPLTSQCLEASKGKRRPMIELFVDENTPDEIWNQAFEVLKTSNGQPAFYNPHVLLSGLQNKVKHISDVDLEKFCGGGCTESMIAGYSNVGSLDAGINLLLILEKCIDKELARVNSFEDFYRVYIKAVREAVDVVTEEISHSQIERSKYNPLPMRTLLVDDCIDNNRDFNNGGARYQWSIINFAGMINVIDSLLVIRDYIFVDKIYKATDFIGALKTASADFIVKLRNHKISYGNDNPSANEFSRRLSSDIFSLLDNKKPYFGSCFLPACIQFQSQADAGKKVGATPDGRKAGAPLCDSLAAIFGKDIKGPTALLNSVTSLDLSKALGVPVLSFNINPHFKNEILKALILGYMKQGGIQIQITCISRHMLEEAYRNPEEHKNLIVRVGGYSEYFYRLSDELKRMIIDRTIQEET